MDANPAVCVILLSLLFIGGTYLRQQQRNAAIQTVHSNMRSGFYLMAKFDLKRLKHPK